jgi:acyl transferase domain-containing protein/acyl carrier protein/SAM-dependent methyltransferase
MAVSLVALEAGLPSPEIHALLTEMLAASLKSLGLFRDGIQTIADLSLSRQPAPYYESWLRSSVRYLQQEQLLSDTLTLNGHVRPLADVWAEWDAKRQAWAADANQQAQRTLVEGCLKALPAILTGAQRATDVMFPNSSMQLVEGIYRGNLQADYFNTTLGDALSAHLERQRQIDREGTLRILEIGAGTGGTTAAVLPVLRRYAVEEYCYTDVSKAFVMYAEQQFRPHMPGLTTAIFDVSKPLASQSIAPNRYDVVIAANVLHATRDITEAVRNAKAVLKNQGVLLLNEISAWSLFNHLTFGLLEGWWLYEDAAVRLPGCPGLAPEQWRQVLTQEGFEDIQFPADAAHRFGQQIVAAVSNGWTRQRIVKPLPARQAAGVDDAGSRVPELVAAGAVRTDSIASTAAAPTTQAHADYVRRVITAKLAEALRMDPATIQDDASLADYGVDSIIGVNLVRTINEALRIELETTSLFEYSTVDQLTQHIVTTWRDAIAEQVVPSQGRSQTSGHAAEPAPAPVPAPSEVETRPARRAMGKTRFDVGPTIEPVERADTRPRAIEPIAIIGMSGRFAEAESLETFWQHLLEGTDLVRPVSRWSPSACVTTASAGRGYCSHGSFIDSIDQFDPAFFGIPALEATYMDPQQRLFLEESWKALEDAGYAGKGVREKACGVYVGCGSSHYDKLSPADAPPQAFWGNSQAVTPARIAYCLNLQGPAIAIDTACSSSLVAMHLACQGLWSGETEMALAGGVFLQPTPGFYQVANRAGMLSPDGKCYSFDARANGFVPGEAVGVVVLKRLRDALADGDHVHGVIVGSGINQDGQSNGLIAPNGRAQERLQRSVYDRFGINPGTIQVLEAHATGTLLGDSIEYGAIRRAFREYTDKEQFCALGTVKTNIGHASTAAGVAGVLKLLLSLKHRQIPPSLHFEQGNPAIDFTTGPFYVNTRARAWETLGDEPRRAAVSSFGFSGTNAHVVIEESPPIARETVASPGYLVVLSARTAEQLRLQARNLLTHLARTPGLSMRDVSFTLFEGRMHLGHRLSCLARDQEELRQLLEQWLETGAAPHVYTAELQEGRVREQALLKKFGNYCIQECLKAASADDYLENLAAVAELYIQGYALEFQRLFAGQVRRIPLPTYPFARERYWVGTREVAVPEGQALPREEPRATGGDDLLTSLQRDLSHIISGILARDGDYIALDAVLMDLGIDSIGLTTLSNAINEKYQLDITPVLFFDYPSVRQIATYLATTRAADVRRSAAAPATAASPAAATAPVTDTGSAARSASPRHAVSRPVHEPIAIVGIAGVMPQSEDLDAWWEHLKNGQDLITVIPEDRWHWEDYYGDPAKEVNKSNSKWGGFMKEVDKFDPLFFGISPREAQMMDPQQRIFLETVWKAIEDSGQKVSELAGTRTGLFVGVGSNDYIDVLRSQPVALDGYTASGNSHSVLANRVSFLLDLRGPSAPIDTACSSSLVALHRAIEAIHAGNCDMAIVGGVQVILSPGAYISFGKAGMLSGEGRCKAFDKRADGYVRGEGCGALLLKPLSVAEAEGNRIYAVIKASSENHGGRVSTMTAPNAAAQAALLTEAYEKAQIDPATVGYIECHGTGTRLGDPIEVQALTRAFASLYERHQRSDAASPHCGLGTVKPNTGHLETAAGIAGVLKVVLALTHKQIPATINFEEINPYINLAKTPFYIVDQLTTWDALTDANGTPLPRRAGVSSFGFGGANAHAVLEEYVPSIRQSRPAADEPQLIVLSAKTDERLIAYVRALRAYLDKADPELIDLAYTLQVGRDEMPERLAVVASSTEDLKRTLDEILADGGRPGALYRGRATGAESAVHAPRAAEEDIIVQALIARKEIAALAERWVSGARIAWEWLHTSSAPRRISVPTYPFARERYWIPGAENWHRRPVTQATPGASRADADGKGADGQEQEDVTTELQSLAPVWSAVRADASARVVLPESARILLVGSDRAHLEWLRTCAPRAELLEVVAPTSVDVIANKLGERSFDQLLWIAPDVTTSAGAHREPTADRPIIDAQEQGVVAIFRIVKALLSLGYADKRLQWTIVTSGTQQTAENEPIQPAHAGVVGLIGSLAKEYPSWDLRLLDVESLDAVTADECLSLPWDKQGNGLAHRLGEWRRQELAPLARVPQETRPVYRRHGVYVVVGGAGGIGEVWSRFMVEHYQAHVVWIGRRPQDAAIDEKIQSIARLGPAPLYVAADATSLADLTRARDTIANTHPVIHGIVHSALVLRDQSLARMDEETFRASLAAKIDVSVNLDRLFGTPELDFILFFSSIVAFIRSAGQANYAAGCTFTDSFAHMLRQQRPYLTKVMNWGYWGTVGVAADDAHRKRMAQMGLGSIEPQEGMAALDTLVNSEMHQVALIKTVSRRAAGAGDAESLARVNARRHAIRTAVATSASGALPEEMIAGYIRQIITETLAEELRLDAAMIRPDALLQDYGVDSIAGINLSRALSETLRVELEPARLFEYSTVSLLTGYILTTWQRQIADQLLGVAGLPREPTPAADISGEQALDMIACQEAPRDGDYEQVTF